MFYTTLDQLIGRYGERLLILLTDRAVPPAGVIDPAVVAQEQVNTDAVIDGYLAGRYALPLISVPPLLTDLALAIAIYKLHAFAVDPKIQRDYDAAIMTLTQIAKGVIRLPSAGLEPDSSGATGVEAIDRERPLTPETMRGFI